MNAIHHSLQFKHDIVRIWNPIINQSHETFKKYLMTQAVE